MGITIHYQGKIDNKNKLPQMVAELMDFAEVMDWRYNIIDNHNEPRLSGIILDIHPESESFQLTFDDTGELKSYISYQDAIGREKIEEVKPLFVKTQFAGVETHITIIKLLQYIKKKYVSNLKVTDEGKFWNIGDIKLLREKFAYLNKAIKKTKGLFLAAELSKGVKSDEELLDKIETLLKMTLKKKEQPTIEQLKQIWGKDAIITKVGKYNLVHLDFPSPQEIKERIEKAKNGEYDDDFDDGCPLCQAMKGKSCEIVFDCSHWCPDCDRKDRCEYYQTEAKYLFEEEFREDTD